MLLEALGINVFYIFAALSALAVFYIHKNVLETKGRTLEDIELYWETKQV